MGQKQDTTIGFHALESTSYKDQAYRMIKDAILYRRFKVGVVYSQDSVCTEMGISRTPVREALLELQKEGYVYFMRGRGFAVLPVTAEEARDIVEMRYYIELTGCRLAAERHTVRQLDNIYKTIELMQHELCSVDPVSLYKFDREFHRAIFEAAGNKKLLMTMEDIRDNFLRFETLTAFDRYESAKAVLNEHIAVYESIKTRSCDFAEKQMSVHLKNTVERTVGETRA